ncbi:unnamed protein product, partial [Coregonus sp. 'balchen']
MAGVGVPFTVALHLVSVANMLQVHRAGCLPVRLRSWDFLPVWMHSLQPLDTLITKVKVILCCLKEVAYLSCLDDIPMTPQSPPSQKRRRRWDLEST